MSSVRSDLRRLIRDLEDAGLDVRRGRRGWKVYDRPRLVGVLHETPSDWRHFRNLATRLRRNGVELRNPTTRRENT